MNKNIELIGLIYKSPTYLELLRHELGRVDHGADGWIVGSRIVANDATPEILELLKSDEWIPHTVYQDRSPNAYYLNRVYRAWNHAGFTSTFDHICFVNSDMIFSRGWLGALLENYEQTTIPCARLIESGKLRSGTHALNQDFGRSPTEFRRADWERYVVQTKVKETKEQGLFMPCVFPTKEFVLSGGYPEGNIYEDGPGTQSSEWPIESGDRFFFRRMEQEFGLKHVTMFNSLVYHIQTGEMDERLAS